MNRLDVGFKRPVLHRDLVICQFLAQDLDIAMLTMEPETRDYEVLVKMCHGGHDIDRPVHLNRGID
jgi:hypothetical protein